MNFKLSDARIQEILWDQVRGELSCSAHDVTHVERVVKLCKQIAKGENKTPIELDVLIYAAILHDIARVKEDLDPERSSDHAVLGAQIAKQILKEIGVSSSKTTHICECILAHRFRGKAKPKSIEAKILFDADKLDGLGATGIARMYMVAGANKEPMFVDLNEQELVEYRAKNTTKEGKIIDFSLHSPNLEYEMKMKIVPAQLYTKTASEMAAQKLKIMDDFFAELKSDLI